jgi:hypothetical protein
MSQLAIGIYLTEDGSMEVKVANNVPPLMLIGLLEQTKLLIMRPTEEKAAPYLVLVPSMSGLK